MGSKFIRGKKNNHVRPRLSAKSQLTRIKNTFPESEVIKNDGHYFEVIIKLRPTSLSELYDVKICYGNNKGIDIYVVNKKLKVAEKRKKLPHVYSHDKQKLCLFSYGENEFDRTMSISSTIIPWASEWLYYYELWLIDGEWLGGGHNEYENDTETNIVKREEKI
jgi:hypothetical protein